MPLLDGEYPIPGCKIGRSDVVTIEDARILWPNFSGAKDKYNAEGDRNFNLHLTKQQADDLSALGWNIKCKFPRPEEDTDQQEERCVLKINVKFDYKPPRIVGVGSRSRNRTEYHAGIAGLIDSAEIVKCDISFVPHFYDFNGNIGVNAYLKTMYFILREDELDQKWADVVAEEDLNDE